MEVIMNGRKLYGRELVGVGLSTIILFLPATPSNSMQNQETLHFIARLAAASAEGRAGAKSTELESPKKKSSPKPVERHAFTPDKKIAVDKITSFFVRANDSKRIQLSILIVHKQEFTQAARAFFNENVTPLLFSVSTLPNRTVFFDPALLRFEQRGRIWQPGASGNLPEVLPIAAGERFGGELTDSQVQQGVILLPEWFDLKRPSRCATEIFIIWRDLLSSSFHFWGGR
jgi:hypothetical protein